MQRIPRPLQGEVLIPSSFFNDLTNKGTDTDGNGKGKGKGIGGGWPTQGSLRIYLTGTLAHNLKASQQMTRWTVHAASGQWAGPLSTQHVTDICLPWNLDIQSGALPSANVRMMMVRAWSQRRSIGG